MGKLLHFENNISNVISMTSHKFKGKNNLIVQPIVTVEKLKVSTFIYNSIQCDPTYTMESLAKKVKSFCLKNSINPNFEFEVLLDTNGKETGVDFK